jgi:hypothetical protein
MDAADPGRRRLGALLVEAGLVSEHDLVEALAEQERSGRRLGEVLVGRGLISAPAVANALAEQHGSFLKTEHGFGTGLRAVIGGDSAPESEATPPRAPPLSPTQPSEPAPGSSSWEEQDGPEEQEQARPDLQHLLFVPTYQGYVLVERSGTAPGLGEIVELPEAPGARLIVAKLALSPLPHDRRICVYLNGA